MVARGKVTSPARSGPKAAITARVGGPAGQSVSLSKRNRDLWVGTCTCSVAHYCVHCLAVALAALESPEARTVAPPRATAAPKERPLMDALGEGLGRPPLAFEAKYVSKIEQLHKRAHRNGTVTLYELAAMQASVPLPADSMVRWHEHRPWPEFPESPVDFWFALAHFARSDKRADPPEFMGAIARVRTPSRELTAYWKELATEEWMRRLDADSGRDEIADDAGAAVVSTREIRLVLAAKNPEVHWRTGPDAPWQKAGPRKFDAFAKDYVRGAWNLAPGFERLWMAILDQWQHSSNRTLSYVDPHAQHGCFLEAVRRLPTDDATLAAVWSASGAPLRRPTEPLVWRATAPETDDGEYEFQVVEPDGTPLSKIVAQLNKRNGIVLTPTTLWSVRLPGDMLDLTASNRVPAPAIESEPGIRFVRRLGIPLPARIADRAKVVVLGVRIDCEVIVARPGTGTPDRLRMDVNAINPDGAREERLFQHGWSQGMREQPKTDGLVVVDRDALGRAAAHLARIDAQWDLFASGWTTRIGPDFPARFAEWIRTVPPGTELGLSPDLESLRSDPLHAEISLECTPVGMDWFDLAIRVDTGGEELTPEEIQLLMAAKGGYARLGAKGWRRLEWNLDDEGERQLARLGLDARQLDPTPQRVHALQLADDAGSRFFGAEQAEEIRRRAGEIKARVSPAVPAAITATLRPYQIEGFHFLAYLSANRFGGVLADDMGLGKTVQTLAWIAWLRENPADGDAAPRRTLIVCPKSVVPNWKSEAERFLPGFKVVAWAGDAEGNFAEAIAGCDALVVNYAQLRILSERVTGEEWLAVIADEAQAIKNPDSQTAQSLRQVRAAHRLALTGTPIENRLLDLWSLMAFAMPGALGSRAQFNRSFGKAADANARRRLSSRLRPFLLRRTKSQVATDLPPRIEEDIHCELEGVQKALYGAEYKRARAMLLNLKTSADLDAMRFHFLTSLLRLRQICCHAALVDERHRDEPSAKLEALLDVLEPLVAEGQKVLVFSQFVGMLNILRETVRGRGWKDFYLAGDTENRGELVNAFTAHEGPGIFLISLKAGGSGLNLACASYVVLFDPWWNPAVEAQAIDRTHRIGQVNTVIAYRLVTKNSIEEKIRELQKQKRLLADDVLGEERFAQSLTLDDLKVLFDRDDA